MLHSLESGESVVKSMFHDERFNYLSCKLNALLKSLNLSQGINIDCSYHSGWCYGYNNSIKRKS